MRLNHPKFWNLTQQYAAFTRRRQWATYLSQHIKVGNFQMNAIAMTPVRTGEFFQLHYRDLSHSSQTLAHEIVDLRDSGVLAANLDTIYTHLAHIFSRTYRVLQLPPQGPSIQSIGEIVFAFEHLVTVLGRAPDERTRTTSAQIRPHLDYFKAHFDLVTGYANGAFASAHAKLIFCEFLFNPITALLAQVFDGYKFMGADPRAVTEFFNFTPVRDGCDPASRAVIEAGSVALEGWCSDYKTWLMYHLVREARPKVAVEIGIYGGRSIVPMAQALKDNGAGTVIGIESWRPSTATHYVTGIANDFWWQYVDYQKLKITFFDFLGAHKLMRHVSIMEASSTTAFHSIDSIDFLHIDGNHSSFGAAHDVVNYFSKLKPGGIVVFDDINWPTTHAGLEIIMSAAELIHVVPISDTQLTAGCAAFRKI